MENKRKSIHYGFVIIICCCLMMGVNIGLSFSCAGIFYKPVSESLGVGVGLFGIYMHLHVGDVRGGHAIPAVCRQAA